jgi:hypothetical protein
LQYIQQPDDFALGQYLGPNPPGVTGGAGAGLQRVYFLLPNNPGPTPTPITFTGGVALNNGDTINVQVGDYLEVLGGGFTRAIRNIGIAGQYQYLDVDATIPMPQPDTPPTQLTDASGNLLPANYRIILQPRLLAGEQTLQLPRDIVIDLGPNANYNPTAPLSNPPLRAGQFYEILFAPSGAVIGQATGLGQIYLWVRNDSERTQQETGILRGNATLVTVQTRTGFIATHPVANTADPYQFTRDARSSGM